ncbi:MAG TPA: efflux RND transporter permease subunit [Longimicrobiales bacterium]|nr:efflux RND transporter permease subunit [Longimicrobiales bacterium]
MSIPGTSTRRPVAVWMLFLSVILLGGIAFARLPIDLLPDVSFPRLVVYTSYPDVAPAEVERLVTERIEAECAAVPGVERVTSVSREGVSLVTLRFAWGTDMDFAMLNVRERLDNVRESLPESATRPAILRVDPASEPIMVLSVAGGEDLWQTKELAETVFRRRLEQLDGVAQAAVTGGLDREIQVEVDPGLLDAYGITLQQVSTALAQANVSAPGGTILQGRYRYPLRTLGEFLTVEEIADVVVARQGADAGSGAGAQEGSGGASPSQGIRLVRLRDIGRVVDGFADRESIARYNGLEAVGLLVFKESGANTVDVAEAVDEVLAQLSREYPVIQVDVAYSQAGFIASSIANVVGNLISGALLAFFVLFFFLRDPRYPVAIALAIPISVMGTFALMEAFDVSLNIMSLGGLALGVGMLGDNSIVVLENIFRHRKELGASPVEAATRGAEEVQGAIVSSTLTTIAVFGPIIYVEGVAGELFKDLSLSVAFSLLVSILVAITLLPSLAARFASSREERRKASAPEADVVRRPGALSAVRHWVGGAGRALRRAAGALAALATALFGFWTRGLGRALSRAFTPLFDAFDKGFDAFAEWYHKKLVWSLDRPGTVLGGAAAALVVSLVVGAFLERDLLPPVDQGALEIRLELPEGTALEATSETGAALEAAALADPDVSTVFSTVGRDVRAYASGEETTGLNTATLKLRLDEGADAASVAARLRELDATVPEGSLAVQSGQVTELGAMLGGSDADIAVRVRAEDLDEAYAMAEEIQRRLALVAAVGNVRLGTERGQRQVQVEIDRAACAAYGVDPRVVAETVDGAMRGDRATEFLDFDRKIDVVVRYPQDLRYSRETLETLKVDGVPIRELVRVQEALGPAEVHREDQGRVVSVYADVVEGGLDQAIGDVEGALTGLPVSRELRWDVGGENEEMRRSFRDLAFAFALAILLVYMILAAEFESFIHPFTILMSVPLALVGALLSLALTGNGINTMSLIGLVILVGIVDNDAVVKVDFIVQCRRRGMSVRDAILEAGRVRLRPIIMTTVTTVLGLLPMALGFGQGAELRSPMAITVIGGLTVATALTLVVVPVVYQTMEGVAQRARSALGATAAPEAGP